jgi:hypothetical protein
MRYEVTGRGGLYPEGCIFRTRTATGAVERFRSVRRACGSAEAKLDDTPISPSRLVELAEAELA